MCHATLTLITVKVKVMDYTALTYSYYVGLQCTLFASHAYYQYQL